MPAPPHPPWEWIASVLVIDDNRDVADSLARFLTAGYGHNVTVARDGETGVQMAAAHPPDVVVCDLHLPTKTGFEVARELMDVLPRKPLLIAVTAHGGSYPAAHARRAGFDHYLVKPADPHEIGALIEAHGPPNRDDPLP
jgi:DNA-binding response OmpR family regulator